MTIYALKCTRYGKSCYFATNSGCVLFNAANDIFGAKKFRTKKEVDNLIIKLENEQNDELWKNVTKYTFDIVELELTEK